MQSLTFILEASLLAPLVEFATSTSGHVEPRQGLALVFPPTLEVHYALLACCYWIVSGSTWSLRLDVGF